MKGHRCGFGHTRPTEFCSSCDGLCTKCGRLLVCGQCGVKRELADDQLLHIFVEIVQGRGQHGGFLRSFAEAFSNADAENRIILQQAAERLIEKYKLQKYLSNFVV